MAELSLLFVIYFVLPVLILILLFVQSHQLYALLTFSCGNFLSLFFRVCGSRVYKFGIHYVVKISLIRAYTMHDFEG